MNLVRRLLWLIFLLALAGCQKAMPAPATPPPPKVSVTTPTEEAVTDFEEFPGRLMPYEMVEVRSRVSGYLEKVLFRDGETIKAGQPLFEIDARPYQAEFDRTAAAVAQAEARLERLKRQEERAKGLLVRKAISQEDYDTALFDRQEAEAATLSAKASHETAKLDLEFTHITAKIDGRLSRRLADAGNLVKADETPLATIVALDPVYAYFDIDERTLLRLQRLVKDGKLAYSWDSQLPVQLALADEDQFSLTGNVNFTDNQVDPATGTLRSRAIVDNESGLLSPGLFVRLRIPVGPAHPALLVPEESLGSDQGQRFLYVVGEDNKVSYRRVKVGQSNAGRRVITDGLKPGERVIVTGLQRVRPGIVVDAEPLDASQTKVAASSTPVPSTAAPATGQTRGAAGGGAR